jgi:hypothetical protein
MGPILAVAGELTRGGRSYLRAYCSAVCDSNSKARRLDVHYAHIGTRLNQIRITRAEIPVASVRVGNKMSVTCDTAPTRRLCALVDGVPPAKSGMSLLNLEYLDATLER